MAAGIKQETLEILNGLQYEASMSNPFELSKDEKA